MARKSRKPRPTETPAQRIISEIWVTLRTAGSVSGRHPTEAALADWIAGDCPLDARAEATERLTATLAAENERYWREIERLMLLPADHPAHHHSRDIDSNPVMPVYLADANSAEDLSMAFEGQGLLTAAMARARDTPPEWLGIAATEGGPRAIYTMAAINIRRLEAVHAIWGALPPGNRPKHPLTPILLAWHGRAGPQYRVRMSAALPQWHRADPRDLRLLDGGAPPPSMADLSDEAQLMLPEFHREPVDDGAISWILALYALAGGAINGVKTLPPALVMAVGAMAHLHVRARDFNWHPLFFPTMKTYGANWPLDTPPPWPEDQPPPSMEEWLYPGGMTNRWRDWKSIQEGMSDIHQRLTHIPIHGPPGSNIAMDVQWIAPSMRPMTRDTPFVELSVRIPQSAAYGAPFDWPYFLSLARGGRSGHARLAKAYLSAVAYMGRTAEQGMPLTSEIPAAILGPNGKPVRGKGGKIKRDPDRREPNPKARFLKPLSGRALARMEGFPDPSKQRIQEARRDFEKLAADGVLELVREGRDRFLIAGPPKVRALSVSKPGVTSRTGA